MWRLNNAVGPDTPSPNSPNGDAHAAQPPPSAGLVSSSVREVDSHPPGAQLKSGSAGEDVERVGGGGCTAWGLSKLSVCASPEAAKIALDGQIGKDLWSVPGSTWHPEVVKRAVVQQGFHFHKLDLTRVKLRVELKRGQFLIDGVLNASYVTLHRGKKLRRLTDPDDATTPYNNEGQWRHSVAVSDGRILEKKFTMSTQWLWLNGANHIQRDKGALPFLLRYPPFRALTRSF